MFEICDIIYRTTLLISYAHNNRCSAFLLTILSFTYNNRANNKVSFAVASHRTCNSHSPANRPTFIFLLTAVSQNTGRKNDLYTSRVL